MYKIFLLCLVSVFLASCQTEMQDHLSQTLWTGTVNAPGQHVTLHFAFTNNFLGKLGCHVSIPQQQLYELPAAECRITGDSLYLEFSEGMRANFKAKLGKNSVSGKWDQGNFTFPLILEQGHKTVFQLYAANALQIAGQNALNSSKIHWERLRQQAMKTAGEATSTDELIPVLQKILRELGDKHGFVLLDNQSLGFEKDDFANVSPALRRAAYGHDKDIVSRQISDSVAYIRIPRSPDFRSGQDENYNRQVQKHICDLIRKGAKHWIIDLRLNEGGSMFAMLGGLNALIGEGKVGSFVNSAGVDLGGWVMKGGNFYNENEQMTSTCVPCTYPLRPGKIAVLTGPITASSGEAVAVALRSLNNTKIIGEATKGFTTSLSGFPVGKGLTLFLSTGYYADAKGHIYRQGISPDIPVAGGDDFEDILKDKKVAAASRWVGE